ncbi:MAG: HAD hydrolase family protein, partial [Anaerotignaceae bacterium]
MKNKIVFFDVDGTLIDFSNKIPSSTIESLNKLKSLGHKIYICTGRSLVQLQKKLSEIDFNGIICASAAYVECEGNVIYENPMPVEDAMKVLEFFKKHEVLFSFQAKNQTLIEKKWLERYRQYFQDRFSITFP